MLELRRRGVGVFWIWSSAVDERIHATVAAQTAILARYRRRDLGEGLNRFFGLGFRKGTDGSDWCGLTDRLSPRQSGEKDQGG
jgi:hypothetical protein